ncbi:MAG: ribosomal-processing cysteine protease Prp [Mycoplasmoidaceae bacterium]
MITIKIFNDGIYANGHAMFHEKGEDIICSAVSAILQGFMKSFSNNEIIYSKINNKTPSIYFKIKSKFKNDVINILITQLKCVYYSQENFLKLFIIKDNIFDLKERKKNEKYEI